MDTQKETQATEGQKPRYNLDPLGRRLRGHRTPYGKDIIEQVRDIEIARITDRYRYVRSENIWKLLPEDVRGKDFGRFQDRLTNLFHEKMAKYDAPFLDWPQEQDAYHNSQYTSGVFEKGKGAKRCLVEHGIETQPRDYLSRVHPSSDAQFPHSLMICDALASVEIGARSDPYVRFVTWQEIYAKAPKPTSAIPVSVSYKFPTSRKVHNKKFKLKPDALFGLEYTYPDTPKSYLFFALEAERKNRVRTTNLDQTSWLKKYLGYKYIIDNKLFKSHLGLPNFLVLTVAPTDARIKTMRDFVMEATNSKGSAPFLFHTLPVISYRYPGLKFPPMPDLYNEPYSRAGRDNFHINKP
jgi:hypothetical protein